jgi:hypothetical protein
MLGTLLKLLLIFVSIIVAGSCLPATAQPVKGVTDEGVTPGGNSVPSGETPSQFLMDPEAQIKGNDIKRKTYRSQPAGQNQNWNLDIGRFQPPINEDPNQLAEDLEDSNYSGVRLRLPFRGRTNQ